MKLTPEQIAKGLTQAQLSALLANEETWEVFDNPDIDALQSLVPELLHHEERYGDDWYRLTPLGSDVCQIIAYRPENPHAD